MAENIFIDESGSMCLNNKGIPWFVICLIRVTKPRVFISSYKRFINKNLENLKKVDIKNVMFRKGTFFELKGSALDKETKISLANHLGNSNSFEIYYVIVNNQRINDNLYDNTSRAFNYLIYKSLKYNLKNKVLPDDDYNIHVDERNVKKQAISTMNDYLNINLCIDDKLCKTINAQYYDSSSSYGIQVSDLFSNLFYSYLKTNNIDYKKLVEKLIDLKVIKDIYTIPSK